MILQNIKSSKLFFVFFLSISTIIFLTVAFRNYYVPFNHDETATFFMYIQSGQYMPFFSQVDANNHVLNSFLGNICFHAFGSSPFALRLPNLIGLAILILATYRISLKLNQIGSKIFLIAGLLLSFHWLSFFSACRGYGLSMAMLLMGLSLMLDYIERSKDIKKIIGSLMFFQLAMSANLILIIVVLLLSVIILLVQWVNKTLFNFLNLLLWVLHFSAIYYWLSFSFFLQDNGALYYGAGESYWKVTFVSLIQLITGFERIWLNYLLLGLFVIVWISSIYVNKNIVFNIREQLKKLSISLLFLCILSVLIIGFYLMHKLLGVNYPEDRTGMFFYLFFILLIAFTFDKFSFKINQLVLFPLIILFAIHFLINMNFRKHSLSVYETIPERFYSDLYQEQKKSKDNITIGGHRVRELFYAFLNYQHGGALSSADPTEVMQMNCDYYIATKQEEKYYKPFYNVIDTEPDWGFVLLKRKEKIVRHPYIEINDVVIKDNENEFINVYGCNDTIFENRNPLLAQISFDVDKISVPANAWFVFQINDSLNQTVYFKRYPLQWSGYDLNNKKHMLCSIITGNLPETSKKVVCFFWNINKTPLSLTIHSLKINQLEGKGVDYEAPDIK